MKSKQLAVYQQAGHPGVNRKTIRVLFGCSVLLIMLIVVVLVRNLNRLVFKGGLSQD